MRYSLHQSTFPAALKVPAAISLSVMIICMVQSMTGCVQQSRWNNEEVVLEQRALDLERRHQLVDQRIDSLWDATALHLAHAIPPGFPPLDSALFINARNADHIRMFMSFHTLDTVTQAMVNAAGEYDALLAKEMHVLLEEKKEFLLQKNAFLEKVAATDRAESQRLAERLRNISATRTTSVSQ